MKEQPYPMKNMINIPFDGQLLDNEDDLASPFRISAKYTAPERGDSDADAIKNTASDE